MAAHVYGLIVSSLVVAVNAGTTSLNIVSTDQNLFPDPNSAGLDAIYLTLASPDGAVRESVLLTARTGNVLTVVRGQLATSPQPFAFGSRVELVLDSEPAEALVAFWGNFYNVPQNTIIMWHGAIGSIPAGWTLCDGTEGTPDLRDRFLLGAGGDRNPADVGGSDEWTVNLGGVHDHGGDVPASGAVQAVETDDAPDTNVSAVSHQHAIVQEPAHQHTITGVLPPYYAAVFIMKL